MRVGTTAVYMLCSEAHACRSRCRRVRCASAGCQAAAQLATGLQRPGGGLPLRSGPRHTHSSPGGDLRGCQAGMGTDSRTTATALRGIEYRTPLNTSFRLMHVMEPT